MADGLYACCRSKFITWWPLQECDYLRAIAHPHLQVSTVVDTKTGKVYLSDFHLPFKLKSDGLLFYIYGKELYYLFLIPEDRSSLSNHCLFPIY